MKVKLLMPYSSLSGMCSPRISWSHPGLSSPFKVKQTGIQNMIEVDFTSDAGMI